MNRCVVCLAALSIILLFGLTLLKCNEFDSQQALGENLMREGRYAEALGHLRAAEGVARRSRSVSDLSRALDNEGVACQMVGDYLSGELLIKQALAAAEKKIPVDVEFKSHILFDLGQIYRAEDKYELAEAAAKQSLALLDGRKQPEEQNLADCLSGLAAIYTDEKKYSLAEAPLKRALSINERLWNNSDPACHDDQDVADNLDILARICLHTNRTSEAEKAAKRALEIYRAAFGEKNANVAYCSQLLALISFDQCQYEETEHYYKQAIAASTLDPVCRIMYIKNLGRFYCSQDRYKEAEGPLKEALAMSLKMLGQDNLAANECFSSLAELYDMWHRPDQARAVRKQAVEVLQAALGPDHPAVRERRQALANGCEPSD